MALKLQNYLVLTILLQDENRSWEAVGKVAVIYFILVVMGTQQSVVALHLVVHRRHATAGICYPQGVGVLPVAPVRDILPDSAVLAFIVLFPDGLGRK